MPLRAHYEQNAIPISTRAFRDMNRLAERYNRVAVPIMKKHGVQMNDLPTFALPRLDSIQQPHDVHFTPEGYRLLAEQVANSILDCTQHR